jgi:sulfite reductase alpha subunit-like flavoprotein
MHTHVHTHTEPTCTRIHAGPGTGIAPFRSFLWERICLSTPRKHNLKSLVDVDNPVLAFFGCRDSQGDNLYSRELREMCAKDPLLRAYTAFSRDDSCSYAVYHDHDDLNDESSEGTHDEHADYDGVREAKTGDDAQKDQVSSRKTYVQDLIRKHSKLVWQVLERSGCVYVAGRSGGMPMGVRDAVEYVVQNQGKVREPKEYVDAMIREGRYAVEVW